jgi:hypothetical protein
MLARTRPDSNLRAVTGEEWETGSRAGVIAALVLETRPTAALALVTEEVEGTALAIDKSRNPRARQTVAPSAEHLPA